MKGMPLALAALIGLCCIGAVTPASAGAQCMGCLDLLAGCSHMYHYDYPYGTEYEGNILEAECHFQDGLDCQGAHLDCIGLRGLDLDAAFAAARSSDVTQLVKVLRDTRFAINQRSRAMEVRSCDGTLAARIPLSEKLIAQAVRVTASQQSVGEAFAPFQR